MFNGMMDPELMRIAQEQMSKIPPSELAKMQQQIMSNPELIRMASESMKNMRPEDFKNAAEQLKYARSEDMAEIGKKIADATPEEIAAFSAQADSQVTYALNAAQMLKKQGNELHSQGRFCDAAEKYLHAKKNLKAIPFSKGRSLQLACSLNLMSCYLKTRQCEKCIKEGTEVLKYEAENVKALYRRGQAYKELGMFDDAVSDLSKAHAVSPDDETITAVLRVAEEELSKGGGKRSSSKGLVIEEITDEDIQTLPQQSKPSSSSSVFSVDEPQEARKHLERESGFNVGNMMSVSEPLQGLKNDPEAIRSFQNFISNPDPNILAALSAGNAEGMPPDMIKNVSSIISKMPPEELQRMIHMASSFQGKNPFMHTGSVDSSNSTRSGPLPHDVSPEMLKAASDMMSKMPAEDLQRMFEMASTLKGNSSVNDLRSNNRSELSDASEIPAAKMKSEVGESSSSNSITNSRSAASQSQPSSASAFMNSNNDFQEQMRNQMNDPAMRQMFTSMIKNMSPDMMANMSEQFGIKLSKEDAEKAQQAMSSLSPDDLDRMMRWADRLQRTVEGAKKTKNWLLGKPGLIFAICMLILAMILHRLGFIGS